MGQQKQFVSLFEKKYDKINHTTDSKVLNLSKIYDYFDKINFKSNMISAKDTVVSARNRRELENTSNVFGYIDAGICEKRMQCNLLQKSFANICELFYCGIF